MARQDRPLPRPPLRVEFGVFLHPFRRDELPLFLLLVPERGPPLVLPRALVDLSVEEHAAAAHHQQRAGLHLFLLGLPPRLDVPVAEHAAAVAFARSNRVFLSGAVAGAEKTGTVFVVARKQPCLCWRSYLAVWLQDCWKAARSSRLVRCPASQLYQLSALSSRLYLLLAFSLPLCLVLLALSNENFSGLENTVYISFYKQ